ncbi:MAG: tetratricopeptide repeat protein [Deinococcales bacterium]
MGLENEWLIPIQGLSLPSPGKPIGLGESHEFGAITLFCRHAKRHQPTFELTHHNLAAVLHICQLLFGSPLGIELAASWVRVLSPERIAEEISKNLDFIASRQQHLPKRHRSMRMMFAYSWQLLKESEQFDLLKLAIFQGGFSDEAAQEVAGVSLGQLSSLSHKSLLQFQQERYSLHPLIKQYLDEKLSKQTQLKESIAKKHANFYLRALSIQKQTIFGHQHQQALSFIENNLDNLRTAWRWSLKGMLRDGQVEALLEGLDPLKNFYEQKGRALEGSNFLSDSLNYLEGETRESDKVRGYIFSVIARLELLLANYAKAVESAKKALEYLRPLNESAGIMAALNSLGASYASEGDYDKAALYVQEALNLAKASGASKELNRYLINLSTIKQAQGLYEEGEAYLTEGLEVAEYLNNAVDILLIYNNLGALKLSLKKYSEARLYFEKGIRLAEELGSEHLHLFCLSNLSLALLYLKEFTKASKTALSALEIAKGQGEQFLETGILTILGQIELALDHEKAAEDYFRQSLTLAEHIGDVPAMLKTISHWALLFAKKEPKKTEALLSLVCEHSASHQEDRDGAAQSLKRLALARGRESLNLESALRQLLSLPSCFFASQALSEMISRFATLTRTFNAFEPSADTETHLISSLGPFLPRVEIMLLLRG